MLELLLAEVGKNLLSKGVDTLLGELLPAVDRAGEELKAEIGALRAEARERFDRQDAAPLLAGIEQLELGRFDRAMDRLIDARAVESNNPVASLLLGLLLAREGRAEPAARRIGEAMLLNPYVFPGLDDVVEASLPAISAAAPPGRWLRLSRAQPRASWRMKVLATLMPDSRAQALGIAYDPFTASGHAVLLWDRAPRLGSDKLMVLTSLPLLDGNACTRTLIEPCRLALVTPRWVILERANGDLGFYDVATLEPRSRDMRPEYFRVVFCPSWPAIRESPRYRRAHQAFQTEPGDVRRALADPQAGQSAGYEFRTEGRTPIARETISAEPPFGPEDWHVRALNEYWLGPKSLTDSTPTLHCRGAFGRA